MMVATPRRNHKPRRQTQDENNIKHRLFAAEYLVDYDPVAAYKRAGYKAKDDHVAYVAARRLLKNVYVQHMIDTAVRERCEEIKDGAKQTVDRLNRVYLEAMRCEDWQGAVAALRELGKHYGIFEKHNKQKASTREDAERLRSELESLGVDFRKVNYLDPSEN